MECMFVHVRIWEGILYNLHSATGKRHHLVATLLVYQCPPLWHLLRALPLRPYQSAVFRKIPVFKSVRHLNQRALRYLETLSHLVSQSMMSLSILNKVLILDGVCKTFGQHVKFSVVLCYSSVVSTLSPSEMLILCLSLCCCCCGIYVFTILLT